jgi:hypothetical protein
LRGLLTPLILFFFAQTATSLWSILIGSCQFAVVRCPIRHSQGILCFIQIICCIWKIGFYIDGCVAGILLTLAIFKKGFATISLLYTYSSSPRPHLNHHLVTPSF